MSAHHSNSLKSVRLHILHFWPSVEAMLYVCHLRRTLESNLCWLTTLKIRCPSQLLLQIVVNYASNSGAAEDAAEQIRQSGGDAITVKADLANREDIQA